MNLYEEKIHGLFKKLVFLRMPPFEPERFLKNTFLNKKNLIIGLRFPKDFTIFGPKGQKDKLQRRNFVNMY